MPKLIFVRHSIPAIDRTRPAQTWPLAPEGQHRAVALAQTLYPHAPQRVITSTEPKAAQTGAIVAEVLQVPCATASDLHEHERDNVGWLERAAFEALVARFFAAPDELVLGRETARQARTRFTRAVENVVAAHPTENLVIVTHGTVLTLFAAPRLQQDPFTFWTHLAMPAVVELPTFILNGNPA